MILAAALASPLSPATAQQLPPGYEIGIMELRADGLEPVSARVVVDSSMRVLLPVSTMLELTRVPWSTDATGRRITLARPGRRGSAVLEVEARRIESYTQLAIGDDDLLELDGVVYLASHRMAALLEAEIDIDLGAVAVTLRRDPPFPAQVGAEALRRRALAGVQGREERDSLAMTVPFRSTTGFGVLDWGVSSAASNPFEPSAVQLNAGAALVGGMARVGIMASNVPGHGWQSENLHASYLRVFSPSSPIRQVQLGDVVADGMRARSLRGVTVTNAPFVRGMLYGEAAVAPSLPPGWEYEVYRDGRLLGFSDAAARAPVMVPLQYGSTPLQLRLYGPNGEVMTSDLVYVVPVNQLAEGRLEYSAGAGTCPQRSCESYGYGEVRHGTTRWLTLFAGADRMQDTASSTVHPYGGFSAMPAPGWSASLQWMHESFTQLSVQSHGSGAVSGRLFAAVQQPGAGLVSVAEVPQGSRVLADATLGFRRRARSDERPGYGRSVDLTGRVEGTQGGGVDNWRAGIAATVRRVLVETGAERPFGEELTSQGYLRATMLIPSWSRVLRSPVLTVGGAAGAGGVRNWEISGSVQPRDANVSGSVRWSHITRSTSAYIGASLRLGGARVQARVAARGSGLEGSVSTSGAIAFTPGGPPVPIADGALGMAGVRGRVFYDEDGDGRFGPGDRVVEGAGIDVGNLRVRTSTRGSYAAWMVLPYEVVTIAVDTTNLPDPSWITRRTSETLRPAPHLFQSVDFPLQRTRELVGRLVAGDGVRGLGGITVVVRDTETGEEHGATTFSDGEFYLARIRAGSYEIRVAESSLSVLGARTEPRSMIVAVPASGDSILVEASPITLVLEQRRTSR